MAWFRNTNQAPLRFRPAQPKEQHHRHRRKYAEGNLGEDISFYFRGPEDKFQLRAQNLSMFGQLAQGWMMKRGFSTCARAITPAGSAR
jgi:hypothetical protein